MSPVQAALRNLELAFYNTQPTCQPNKDGITVLILRQSHRTAASVFWIFEKQKEERPALPKKRGAFCLRPSASLPVPPAY